MPSSPNAESGRRGNFRYMYGSHAWVPEIQSDFSRGIVQDVSRNLIPSNGVFDCRDYLVHIPGGLYMRGAYTYAGPAMTAATYAAAVAYAEFPAGSKLVAVGDNGHIYTVTGATTTDVGGSTVTTVDTPKLRIGGAKNLLIFPQSNGTGGPIKYDGSAAPAALGGTPAAGKFCALYKSRLALGGSSANPNRIYFSPTPDIESTWDTTNAWVDCDHAITGLAALSNALLVFSYGHLERILGTTPPPNSDMDRQPVADIGCSDARSIAIYEGSAIFANPRGVYITNGTSVQSLTGGPHGNDGIASYWQNQFAGGDLPSTYSLSGGVIRDFYFVTYMDNTGLEHFTLVCHIPTRAWTRFANIKAAMFAPSVGVNDELYYADRTTNRVVALSKTIVPNSTGVSAVDANGGWPAPWVKTRNYVGGTAGVKAFGDVVLTCDFVDAPVSTSPTLAVQYQVGEDNDKSSSYRTATNSPFPASTRVSWLDNSATRRRSFVVGVDGQAIAFNIAQTNATTMTVIRSIEVNMRSYPYTKGGPYA